MTAPWAAAAALPSLGAPPADPLGWPVDPPHVGVGDHTAEDRERFERIVRGHVAYVANMRGRLPDLRYALLDLNAGCGGYVASKQPRDPATGRALRQWGTTPRALRVLERSGVPFRLGAIEHDPRLAALLRTRLSEPEKPGGAPAVDVLVGRHEDLAAAWVREHMRGKVRGLIVHDPNAELSRDTLGQLAALPETHYVDFLLHFNGAIVKWHGTKRHTTVEEALALCGKRFAYVGPLIGNWQWAWLLLSNGEKLSTSGGLVRADRPAGRQRLTILAHTRDELKAARRAAQKGLFDDE